MTTVPASVDTYLAGLSERERATVEALRAAIRELVPDATETISYGMPTFRVHGRSLVSYAAFRDHYSLFPLGSSVIDAHLDELARYRTGKGTLRFEYEEPLPAAAVALVVRERLAENAARERR